MAATKAMTAGDSEARLSSAGPGHNPTRPQPTPNNADPITSERSRPILVGQKLWVAMIGRGFRLASMNPGTETARAAIMTMARLGSQAPKISRKPRTFVGCTIPEISRPAPKINPQNKDAIISMVQPPNMWRVTATVVIAASMKMTVAAMERSEKRATPQMP